MTGCGVDIRQRAGRPRILGWSHGAVAGLLAMFFLVTHPAWGATFTVTNTSDSGAGSLRQAVADAEGAAGADEIVFDSSLAGATITLTSAPLVLTDDVTIRGLGADRLTISGSNVVSHFKVTGGVSVIEGLALVEGLAATSGIDRNGGAVKVDGGDLTIESCLVADNVSNLYGGGLQLRAGVLTVRNSLIRDNVGPDDSGGINIDSGTCVVLNCTITGNTTNFNGGGVGTFGGSTTIYNSTIVGNTADADGNGSGNGGGVFRLAPVALVSTIVADNVDGSGERPDISGIVPADNCLIKDTSGGTLSGSNNIVGVDPQLGPLQFNGGAADTFALGAGSPAIGAGSNVLGLTSDQRGAGFGRELPSGSPDIGAFEYNGDSTAPDVTLSTPVISPTNANPIAVTVTFTEPVFGLDDSELAVTNGTAARTSGSDGDSVYVFAVTPLADGTVTVDLAAGVVIDNAVNENTAAAPVSVVYDGTAPTTALTTTAPDPTNTSPIPVTVTFSEGVTGFTDGEFAVTNGTALRTGGVDGDGTYTFDVTPDNDGTVSVGVTGGVALDDAGNGNTAATGLTLTFDATGPVVALLGSNPVDLEVGDPYVEAGATAFDAIEGDVSGSLVISGSVDTSTPGTYFLTYDASDSLGNAGTPAVRVVNVVDTTPPVISLVGANPLEVSHGTSFVDPGATATDNVDGDVTGSIVATSTVDTSAVGTYSVTYEVSDSSGNAATPVVRTVEVVDTTGPVITIIGENPFEIGQGETYVDPGATATDAVDGDVTGSIVVTDTVDTSVLGSYSVTYEASDSSGNSATPAVRVVEVVDVTAPTLTVLGENPVYVQEGETYTDAGATAVDDTDEDITGSIVVTNPVDTSVVGEYVVEYAVSDSAGNTATDSRTVFVTGPPEVFYVDGGAPSSGTGGVSDPFVTIGEGLNAVMPGRGDIVRVRRGVYEEVLSVPLGAALVSEEGPLFTFIRAGSAPGDLVTLGDGTTLRGFAVGDSTGAGVMVSDDAEATVTNGVLFDNVVGIDVGVNGVVAVDNNTFSGNLAAIEGQSGAVFDSLANNVFEMNGTAVRADSGAILSGGYNAFWENGVDWDGPAAMGTDLAAAPLFVAPSDLNFTLRFDSPYRDGGNPATAFDDPDGSRNDVGATGGPDAYLDVTAPVAVIDAAPMTGRVPVTVTLDGSGSSDAAGVARYEWDFDTSDGVGVDDTGPVVSVTYDVPSTYTVTLRVSDHNGNASEATVTITATGENSAPTAEVFASPIASAAPVAVQLQSMVSDAEGDSLALDWDVDAGAKPGGKSDPVWDIPTGTAPGSYRARAMVTDSLGAQGMAETFVTVTQEPPLSSKRYDVVNGSVVTAATAEGGEIALSLSGGATNKPIALSVGVLMSPPMTPPRVVSRVLEAGPQGVMLSETAVLTLPLTETPRRPDLIEVKWYDDRSGTWRTTGVREVDYVGGAAPVVTFEATRLGLFVVELDVPDEDINRDGVVNAVDIQLSINAVLGVAETVDADVNGDGALNSMDTQRVINAALLRSVG